MQTSIRLSNIVDSISGKPLFLFTYNNYMEVTDEMVANLASLSRLSFNETEKEEIKKDLQRMISFVDKLKGLDTTGIEPLLHMSEMTNVYRQDLVGGSMDRAEALKNAPKADDQFFKVPKVIRNPSDIQS